MLRVAALLVLVAIAEAGLSYKSPAITQDLIDTINQDPTSTWKAGWNSKFMDATLGDAMSLCGTIISTKKPDRVMDKVNNDVPTEFDSRKNWPACSSIGHIRDQSACGSCWAFGAVEAFEDRQCIASNHKVNVLFSPYDLTSCCGFTCGEGCNGGQLAGAWGYIERHGLVTGGDYADNSTCAPYTLPPCDHHVNGTLPPCGNTVPTPKCVKTCQASYKGPNWDNDKHFASDHYAISDSVPAIQTEIMNNGPIECAFSVYADFLTYKNGVYQHKTGSYLGGHAIKVLGWGTQGNLDYWLVANSWNPDWGDAGYFKILRGHNECGIEASCHVGMAKV